MSNLDFLLDVIDINKVSVRNDGNRIIVCGIIYEEDDLSWTKYEYIFDEQGNYIDHSVIDSYYIINRY